MIRNAILAGAACAVAAPIAGAAIIRIDIEGDVGFNVIQGNQAGVPDGAPVTMSFEVDSEIFVNSPNFPTRGYPLMLPSFSMSVGGAPVLIQDPQPFGDAYFVLRDNDPAVDGFLLSRNIDFPQPVAVTIPGLAPTHDLDFIRTFNDGAALPSLDILDAVGTYDLSNLSVFGWTIGRFGNAGAEYNYQSMTISVIPAPGAAAVLCAAPLFTLRRRRG